MFGTTPKDVELYYPTLLNEKSEVEVQALIGQAERLLHQLVPNLTNCIDTKGIDPLFVQDKIIEAVLRVVRAPDDRFRSESELDYRYEINQRTASGTMWYPDDVLAQLRSCGGRTASLGTMWLGGCGGGVGRAPDQRAL